MFKRMTQSTVVMALSVYSLASIAGTPPITVKLQNDVSDKILKGMSTNAYYLVSLNPAVPKPGLNMLALTGGIPEGVSQIGSVSGTPCGVIVPVCTTSSFSLTPGAQCCLALQLNSSGMNLGHNLIQPIIGTLPTPSTYSVKGEPLKVDVVVQSAVIVGDYEYTRRTLEPLINPTAPLGYYTTNNLLGWSLLAFINSNVNNNTFINNVSCGKSKHLCVAVGTYKDSSSGFYYPVSYSSMDGGKQWVPSLNNFATDLLYGVSCSKSGEHCIAVGNTYDRSAPVAYITSNHGQTWVQVSGFSVNSGESYFNLESIACGKQVKECTAVGFYKNSVGNVFPLSYYTTNSGTTWTRFDPTPANNSSNNYLNGIACDHEGRKCFAVGDYHNSSNILVPLSYHTNNGGASWTESSPALGDSSAKAQYLNGVSCSKDGNNCVAVGNLWNNTRIPFSYYTNNGGQSWTASAIFPVPGNWRAQRRLNAVSCDEQGKICNAVGFVRQRNVNSVSYGYLSMDGGITWSTSTFQSHKPFTNLLNSVALLEDESDD